MRTAFRRSSVSHNITHERLAGLKRFAGKFLEGLRMPIQQRPVGINDRGRGDGIEGRVRDRAIELAERSRQLKNVGENPRGLGQNLPAHSDVIGILFDAHDLEAFATAKGVPVVVSESEGTDACAKINDSAAGHLDCEVAGRASEE